MRIAVASHRGGAFMHEHPCWPNQRLRFVACLKTCGAHLSSFDYSKLELMSFWLAVLWIVPVGS